MSYLTVFPFTKRQESLNTSNKSAYIEQSVCLQIWLPAAEFFSWSGRKHLPGVGNPALHVNFRIWFHSFSWIINIYSAIRAIVFQVLILQTVFEQNLFSLQFKINKSCAWPWFWYEPQIPQRLWRFWIRIRYSALKLLSIAQNVESCPKF
jgi:hypothetical protein